ncbi:hypothetical protein AVEN_242564-1 [Araneus ventricosus]|uniref:Uncharacterized protein n=1 Tax=Araneus ventricosus TaxID=182803 RepID=A0A4Y2UP96_ARAVE|nr:hypothetical protein AVEN_242564-1 [Araneus ventricosus]
MCMSKVWELFDKLYSMFEADHSERFLRDRLRRHMRPPGLEIEAYILAAICMFCLAYLVYADDMTLFGHRALRNETANA